MSRRIRPFISVVIVSILALAMMLAGVFDRSGGPSAPAMASDAEDESDRSASTGSESHSPVDRTPVRATPPESSDTPDAGPEEGWPTTVLVDPETGGEHRESGLLRNGKKEGVWRVYDNMGVLWMEQSFVDGKLDGLTTIWNDDGSKSLERNYRAGKLHGVETGWLPDGTASFTQMYVDGVLEGKWETYHQDGSVKARGSLHDGKYSEYCEFFLPDGTADLSKTGQYEAGKRVD